MHSGTGADTLYNGSCYVLLDGVQSDKQISRLAITELSPCIQCEQVEITPDNTTGVKVNIEVAT
ncbi:hypothetical protein BCON_0008g00580 [Botryotinia convoluta]|uniref:Uncharacterized protein n=1 Tax=Botryotinia convoluta TaxID=54673 RepID=A0A4Z1IRU4_9HELO|nr:hypothetical protein BCON_0008g00580 [Botryotinia convoluta]